MGDLIKCEADENKDEDNTSPTKAPEPVKCKPPKHKMDKEIRKTCNEKMCIFSCSVGRPNINAISCFNGKWNVAENKPITCIGKPVTTQRPITAKPTAKPTTEKPTAPPTEEPCGKKCQIQKEKEQKEKDKEDKKKQKEQQKEQKKKKKKKS